MDRKRKIDFKKSIHYQIPKSIMRLFLTGELSSKGFKIYALMYERAKLSATNGWVDEDGYVFF